MNIIKKLAIAFVALFAFISASADSYYTVTVDKLNVRKGPGQEYEVVDSYSKGDVIKCSDELEGDWVRLKRGVDGYVNVNYIEFMEKETSKKSDVRVNIPLLEPYKDKIPVFSELAVLIVIAAIAALILLMLFLKPSIIINSLLLFVMTLVETYYMVISESPLWFCDHKLYGWLIAGLTTAAFAMVVGIQFISFMVTMGGLAAKKLPEPGSFLKTYFIMWGVYLVVVIVDSVTNLELITYLSYGVLGIQALYAIFMFMSEGDFISGIFMTVVNLICGFGLLEMLILALVCVLSALIRIVAILAGLIVVVAIVMGILSGSKEKDTVTYVVIGW